MNPLYVEFLNGPMSGRTCILTAGENSVGRGPKNDIVLPPYNNQVSLNHAVIYVNEDRIFIQDLSSTNGTYINQKRADSGDLKPGDVVGFAPDGPRFRLLEGLPKPETTLRTGRISRNISPAALPAVSGGIAAAGAHGKPGVAPVALRTLLVRSLLLIIVVPAIVTLFFFRKTIMNLDPTELIILVLLLALALLGFYFLYLVLRSIGSFQRNLKQAIKGDAASIDISSEAARLLEVTEIMNTLNEITAARGGNGSAGNAYSGSSAAKDALKLAKEESRRRGKSIVGSTDLLLALLKTQEGPVADVLRKTGLTYEGAAREVEELEDVSEYDDDEYVEDLSEGLEVIDDEQILYIMQAWQDIPEDVRDRILDIIRTYEEQASGGAVEE